MTIDNDLGRLRRVAGNAVSKSHGDTAKAGRELARLLSDDAKPQPMLVALCIDYLEIITNKRHQINQTKEPEL